MKTFWIELGNTIKCITDLYSCIFPISDPQLKIYYFSIFHPSFLFGLFWTLSDRSHGACFHSLVHSNHGLSSRFWPIESAGNSTIWQSGIFCFFKAALSTLAVLLLHWVGMFTVATGQRSLWTLDSVHSGQWGQCPVWMCTESSSQHSKAWLPPPSPRVSVHPFVCASIFHMPTGTGACSQCSSKHGKSWLPSISTSHSMSTPPSHSVSPSLLQVARACTYNALQWTEGRCPAPSY